MLSKQIPPGCPISNSLMSALSQLLSSIPTPVCGCCGTATVVEEQHSHDHVEPAAEPAEEAAPAAPEAKPAAADAAEPGAADAAPAKEASFQRAPTAFHFVSFRR